MKNRKILIFRLTITGYEGTPKSKKCPVLSLKEKDEIKKYWDKVGIIDDGSEEYDKSDLIKELFDNGKLRQGWGEEYDDMSLDLKQVTDDQSLKIWAKNYIKLAWRVGGERIKSCKKACGRYEILKVMKEVGKGDIVIIPRVPDNDHFTIAMVKEGYNFEKFNGFIGHGHVIDVYNDKDRLKKFKYGKNGIFRKTFMSKRHAVDEIRSYHKIYPKIKKFIETHYL